MGNIWWVGAVLSFVSTAANTVGVNMQKMSAMEAAAQTPDPNQRESYFRQRTWAQGMALIVCGSLGDFFSLAITAQSIIAPIKSSALVVNLAVAHFYLGETLTNMDIGGSVAIVFGSLLSVFFGDRNSREIDSEQLRGQFAEPPFLVYVAITAIFLGACLFFTKKIQERRTRVESFFEDLYVDPSETAFMLQSLRSNETYKKSLSDYTPYMKFHTFLYCALGGSFGGQSLIFVKCVAVLARTTFSGENQFVLPYIYIFLLTMLTFIVGQVHFLNKALIISDAMIVVPVYQCFFITFSTIGGLIFYQEYAQWSVSNWIFSVLGLLIILIGVRALAMRDFDDIEVQFVSTCNVLQRSTFELETPLVSDEESETLSAVADEPRASLSIRLGPSLTVPRQASGGNVFSELSAVASPPLAREIVQIGKHLSRGLSTNSMLTVSQDGAVQGTESPRSPRSAVGLNRSQSSTQWTVIANLGPEGLNVKRAQTLDPEAHEKAKSNELFQRELGRFQKEKKQRSRFPQPKMGNHIRRVSGDDDGSWITPTPSPNDDRFSLRNETDYMDEELIEQEYYPHPHFQHPSAYYQPTYISPYPPAIPGYYGYPPYWTPGYFVPAPRYESNYVYHRRITSQPHLQLVTDLGPHRPRRRKRQPGRRSRSETLAIEKRPPREPDIHHTRHKRRPHRKKHQPQIYYGYEEEFFE